MTPIPEPACNRQAMYRLVLKWTQQLCIKFRPDCASDEDWERICRTALDRHCQEPEIPIEHWVQRFADEFEEAFIDFSFCPL